MPDDPPIESWSPYEHATALRWLRQTVPGKRLRPVFVLVLVVLGFLLLTIAHRVTRVFWPWFLLFAVLGPPALKLAAGWIQATLDPPHFSPGVRFELTAGSLRVVTPFGSRELALSEVERVEVVPVSRRLGIGHVVIHQRGDLEGLQPAIPTGHRMTVGSIGLVTWAGVEEVDPGVQLMDGPLTFWFVTNPGEVAARVRAAVAGVSVRARGPHR